MKEMKRLSPRKTIRYNDILKLQTENHCVKAGWILLDNNTVIVANQRAGESSTATVKFTRREFNALIDWYNREQTLRRQK